MRNLFLFFCLLLSVNTAASIDFEGKWQCTILKFGSSDSIVSELMITADEKSYTRHSDIKITDNNEQVIIQAEASEYGGINITDELITFHPTDIKVEIIKSPPLQKISIKNQLVQSISMEATIKYNALNETRINMLADNGLDIDQCNKVQ